MTVWFDCSSCWRAGDFIPGHLPQPQSQERTDNVTAVMDSPRFLLEWWTLHPLSEGAAAIGVAACFHLLLLQCYVSLHHSIYLHVAFERVCSWGLPLHFIPNRSSNGIDPLLPLLLQDSLHGQELDTSMDFSSLHNNNTRIQDYKLTHLNRKQSWHFHIRHCAKTLMIILQSAVWLGVVFKPLPSQAVLSPLLCPFMQRQCFLFSHFDFCASIWGIWVLSRAKSLCLLNYISLTWLSRLISTRPPA